MAVLYFRKNGDGQPSEAATFEIQCDLHEVRRWDSKAEYRNARRLGQPIPNLADEPPLRMVRVRNAREGIRGGRDRRQSADRAGSASCKVPRNFRSAGPGCYPRLHLKTKCLGLLLLRPDPVHTASPQKEVASRPRCRKLPVFRLCGRSQGCGEDCGDRPEPFSFAEGAR